MTGVQNQPLLSGDGSRGSGIDWYAVHGSGAVFAIPQSDSLRVPSHVKASKSLSVTPARP